MNWKDELKNFIFQQRENQFLVSMGYLQRIVMFFPNLIQKKKSKNERQEYWKKIVEYRGIDENLARQNFWNLIESVVNQAVREGYSSITWPTIIKEPNLFLSEEKTPDEDELWERMFIYYTSVKIGNSLVNLHPISEAGRDWFWQTLVTDKVIFGESTDIKPLKLKLGIFSITPRQPLFVSLSLIAFLVKKAMEETSEKEDILSPPLQKLGIDDNTSLVIITREKGGKMGRRGPPKATYFSFSKLSSIVQKWLLPDFRIINFLDSLDVKNVKPESREILHKEREKLIYFLFKYNTINGEILSKIINKKLELELGKKKMSKGFMYAKQFFSKLSTVT